jgi:hypothetical protein
MLEFAALDWKSNLALRAVVFPVGPDVNVVCGGTKLSVMS